MDPPPNFYGQCGSVEPGREPQASSRDAANCHALTVEWLSDALPLRLVGGNDAGGSFLILEGMVLAGRTGMNVRIDSHHHFWNYNRDEYAWIGPDQAVLQRNFLPDDLQKEIKAARIDGVISVQARQTLEETRWLLELAARHHFILGVVGWVPLIDADVERHLEIFSGERKFRGVRHVLHDEADDHYMLRADFNRGIDLLEKFKLIYDILIFERHLPQTLEFVDRHPSQTFVVDHMAKPRIKAGELEPWRQHIRELAKRPHVACKLSGMVTEADHRRWTPAQLEPYIQTVLECFGPDRLMFGTDWPVCLLASDYQRWVSVVERAISTLSYGERAAIMGGTAARIYGTGT
jgi:L-fuconolactonase